MTLRKNLADKIATQILYRNVHISLNVGQAFGTSGYVKFCISNGEVVIGNRILARWGRHRVTKKNLLKMAYMDEF